MAQKKKADPLSTEVEEPIWTKCLQGSGSPQALVVMNDITLPCVVEASLANLDLIHVRLKSLKRQESNHTLLTQKMFQRTDLKV